MNNRISLACAIAFLMLVSAGALVAQDGLLYRDFQLGTDIASVAKLTGTAASDVKLIHQRPAMLQDLEWRPRYFTRGPSSQTDPVDHMVFSFYNGQLYKIVVDYDARRTEGMTAADIVTAVSTTYGSATIPAVKSGQAGPVQYGQPDVALAMWGRSGSTLTLFRTAYQNAFRLVVSSTALADVARVAGLEAIRLDALDAPQREITRQRKEADDARAAEETAKRANLPGFRP